MTKFIIMLTLASVAVAQQFPSAAPPCTATRTANCSAKADATGTVTVNGWAFIGALSSTPSTCTLGQSFFLTTGSVGIYNCTATNTWTGASGPIASSSNPIVDGTATPGTSTNYSRADHVHPTDTSRASSTAATTVNGQTCTLGSTCTVLGSVTNDTQTKAAIVPNTAPSAGQILAGNAGGTAYAPVAMSGDCTITSAGAITCTKTNGTSFGAGATGTIYNQTIQDNGTAKTKRPTLNLISGTNTTVSCADNAGASKTDCTISSTGTGGGATTSSLRFPAGGMNSNVFDSAWVANNTYTAGSSHGFSHIDLSDTGSPFLTTMFRLPHNFDKTGTVTARIMGFQFSPGYTGNVRVNVDIACFADGTNINQDPTFATALVLNPNITVAYQTFSASGTLTLGAACDADVMAQLRITRDNTVGSNMSGVWNFGDLSLTYVVK